MLGKRGRLTILIKYVQTQCGLLYLSIHTHGFSVLAMLDTGAMRSFVSHKLAAKLPAIVYTMTPLTVALPTGRR